MVSRLSKKSANAHELSLAREFVEKLDTLPEGESGALLCEIRGADEAQSALAAELGKGLESQFVLGLPVKATVPNRPDAPGAAMSREARIFWRERWSGRSLMAIGMKDPVLGPPVMRALHADIRHCPPPLEIADGGHFLQEWGEPVAHAALERL